MNDIPRRPIELIASCPFPIVGMCVFQDCLYVATAEGVFVRDGDGVFRECRFERLSNG